MNDKLETVDIENNNMKNNSKSIKKNVAIMCLAFICVFTSSNAVNNLQSSINFHGDIGLYSLAFLTVGSMFASLILTTPFIFIFGYKWTIMSGQIDIIAYILLLICI